MAVDILGSTHDLPDLVIHNILTRLTTKIAIQVGFVSKQWDAAMSSNPVLNFDEDDDLDHYHNLNGYNDYTHQHNKFINFLQGYSEHRDNKKLIDKLRLHMRMFSCQPDHESHGQDMKAIDRWVELAIKGDVKELDISLKKIVDREQYEKDDMLNQRPATMESCEDHYLYCIDWKTFLNA